MDNKTNSYKKEFAQIDINPTWEEAAPLIIEIITHATSTESIQGAKEELMKMARIADRYIPLKNK
tara:strand:+ start:1046 stop:1240 length:195 start_codon:yes stop_codon:yes gene_type:complete